MAGGKQATPRKIPQRKCVGCNESHDKKELLRIVRTPDGQILTDPTGKLSGRGAYICKKADCLRRAKKAGRLEKNLEVQIPEEIYVRLEGEIAANE